MKHPALMRLLCVEIGIVCAGFFVSVQCQTFKENNVTSCFNYHHCQSSQNGVQDLDCFKKSKKDPLTCYWKSGSSASNITTYTLIIAQEVRDYCKIHHNISKTFHSIEVFGKYEMNAWVIDESSRNRNCSKTFFRGIPNNLIRCDPPTEIMFKRDSGKIYISWMEQKHIKKYNIQLRESGHPSWKMVVSEENAKYMLFEGLNPSLSYEVQVQCTPNQKCPQCSWSEMFLVPAELTKKPVIVKFQTYPVKRGQRSFFINWTFAQNATVDGYTVTVRKESREFNQILNTTLPELYLTLSGSSYLVSVMAFNSAGSSPQAERKLPALQNIDLLDQINVTAAFNKSFIISWDPKMKYSYRCYSIEWGLVNQTLSHITFYLANENSREIKDHFEPFKRYQFILHIRPYKDTCNLRHVNNSETTYAMAEAYISEGRPVSAPNGTYHNVTKHSALIEWTTVPDEDLRGFLQGYVIHYGVNYQEDAISRITVNSSTNTYKLSNLTRNTVYKVQVSALTNAGEGKKSHFIIFKTQQYDPLTISLFVFGTLIGIILGLFAVVCTCSKALKWAKKLFWPNIPNPGNSNAIQKIDSTHALDVLEPKVTLYLPPTEGSDTNSVHIIEEATEMLTESDLPVAQECEELYRGLLNEEEDNENTTYTIGCTETNQGPSVHRETAPFVSDYTTMETFQQTMPQLPVANPQPGDSNEKDVTSPRSDQDYVKQTLCHL
nr:PREDICTED: interleukin-31 receptor subunit alpha-like isoform X1 [Lepisosteus oculatus]